MANSRRRESKTRNIGGENRSKFHHHQQNQKLKYLFLPVNIYDKNTYTFHCVDMRARLCTRVYATGSSHVKDDKGWAEMMCEGISKNNKLYVCLLDSNLPTHYSGSVKQ